MPNLLEKVDNYMSRFSSNYNAWLHYVGTPVQWYTYHKFNL